jgi:hypothetical protein
LKQGLVAAQAGLKFAVPPNTSACRVSGTLGKSHCTQLHQLIFDQGINLVQWGKESFVIMLKQLDIDMEES